MSVPGRIRIKQFLEKSKGAVRGTLLTGAKNRTYAADYVWSEDDQGYLTINRAEGTGDIVKIRSVLEIDESMLAF